MVCIMDNAFEVLSTCDLVFGLLGVICFFPWKSVLKILSNASWTLEESACYIVMHVILFGKIESGVHIHLDIIKLDWHFFIIENDEQILLPWD